MKHPIDELVQRLYGMSDDQLLQAFKEAEAETEAEGGPKPDLKGFERLWNKAQERKE